MVGLGRFELPTSRFPLKVKKTALSAEHSNQAELQALRSRNLRFQGYTILVIPLSF